MPATTDRVTDGVEAWFEYSYGYSAAAIRNGLQRVDDPEDPRWDGEFRERRGGVHGYLQVAHVTRVDGEIVKKKLIRGEHIHMNRAREFLREFKRLKDEGSETPWDQERHFRDMKEQAEKADREGRSRDLEVIAGALKQAIGPLAGQAAPEKGGGR